MDETMNSSPPEATGQTLLPWERAARVVSVIMGLVFAAGVVTKLADWDTTRTAMTVYGTLRFLPPALPAAASLFLETVVAVSLLATPTWRKWGLPACGAFWAFTGVILAIETILGSSGDCGCLPFLPRNISWYSTAHNLSTALFFTALWRLMHVGQAPVTADLVGS